MNILWRFWYVCIVKDFDIWNNKKKILHCNFKSNLLLKEREIWWCSLGLNLGDEEDGKNEFFERPVLIIKKFNNKIAWVLPLSTKSGNPKFYFEIQYQQKESYIILSQLRLISGKRLSRVMGKLPHIQFQEVKNRLVDFLK